MSNTSRYKAFYLPEEMNITWEKFKQIAKRESPEYRGRGSTSKLLQKMITEYVRLHDLGNPQQTLKQLFENGKPHIALGTCSFCERKTDEVGEFHGKKFYLCSFHREEMKKQKGWKI